MKTPYFFFLALCTASTAYAVPTLDDSYSAGSNSTYYSSPTSSSIASALTKLQNDVAQLKVKVNALEHSKTTAATDYLHSVKTYSDPYSTDVSGEKSRYSRAYAIFRDGGYDQAIAEFQSIISTYPRGEYADNSQYWTGEALLKKGNKQAAMVAFDKVIRAYPSSAKVPDALLKLGMTQYGLGNKTKAREYYDYLIDTYPGTSAAHIAIDKKLQAGL